jgi:hypothetical protein
VYPAILVQGRNTLRYWALRVATRKLPLNQLLRHVARDFDGFLDRAALRHQAPVPRRWWRGRRPRAVSRCATGSRAPRAVTPDGPHGCGSLPSRRSLDPATALVLGDTDQPADQPGLCVSLRRRFIGNIRG